MNIACFILCILVLGLATYTDIKQGKIYNESFYPVLLLSVAQPFFIGFWNFLLRLLVVVIIFFVYEGYIGGGDAKLLMMIVMLGSPVKALITLAIATLGAVGYAYIKNPAETKVSLMNSWVALRTFNPSAVKGKGSTVILAPFMLAGFVISTLILGI